MQIENFNRPILVFNKSIKIILNRVVGPLVFVWLSYSIYQQIVRQPNLEESLNYIAGAFYGINSWLLLATVLLSIVNWMVEARKWQVLVYPLQEVSLLRAFKATLAGVAFAVNTPNRIGEYGGRMIYLSKEHRVHSIALTMVGSISQLIVTLVAGLMGLFLMHEYFRTVSLEYISGFWYYFSIVLITIATAVTLLFYFRLQWLVQIMMWIRLPEKWLKYVKVIDDIDVTILLRVLLLSIFRYAVFVCQYVILLQVLQIDVPMATAFWLISILYLILALVPTVTMLELGIRGKTSILLFAGFSANVIGIYAAGMAIWLINLIIPAVAGSVLAAGLKVFNLKK